MRNKSLIVIVILAALVIIEGILLVRFWPRKPKEVIKVEVAPPKVEIVAKIAIVLDDWGYNLHNDDFLRLFIEFFLPVQLYFFERI